jgi:hypothetical protein
MDLTDITKDLFQGENMGGIGMKIFFGLYSDVASWPTKPTNATTLEALGKLTGDITMKPGKRMFEMYVTDDTGEFKIETVGELDGKSFVMHLSLFNPGLKPKLLGLLNSVKNDNLVFIVPDNNNQKFLMGDAVRAAIFTGSPDGAGTGKETAGRRGISMEFVYKTSNVYVYEGSVPLTLSSGTPLTVLTSSTDTTVAGNDGTATAMPNGGTQPWTYSWDTTPVQTTQVITGLVPGTYTVTVTDAVGATATSIATVN